MASTSISGDISHVFVGTIQVLPAPGGDLIRDGASVLPTGRRWPMKREFQGEDLDVLDYLYMGKPFPIVNHSLNDYF